jgi:DNA-binding transcriptional ArsR family regulator
MGFEEDTYTTIFKATQHPIRRRILRMISEKPSTYTEIQRDLNIDNGLLNYHLEALSSLITKNSEEKYTLSDFGVATTGLIRGVEEPSKVTGTASTPPVMKWLAAILAVALIISGVGLIELNNRYVDLSGRYGAMLE